MENVQHFQLLFQMPKQLRRLNFETVEELKLPNFVVISRLPFETARNPFSSGRGYLFRGTKHQAPSSDIYHFQFRQFIKV
ncbi:hypothetical protein CEXT_647641 [Caerostris extrusa]|uniref:Uncharacterized protein n=1 Tax=Caerostris extrusa TaxID=172846 RepID=A0AAV4NTX8_CAEEX|nr:hypothetical protein CEXT_647641 [Caerostris extrusa]